MAPVRTSSRRNQQNQNASARPTVPDNNDAVVNDQLFLEPMMGTPLAVYIEKDVEDRDSLVDIILVSPDRIVIGMPSAFAMHIGADLCDNYMMTRFLVDYDCGIDSLIAEAWGCHLS